MRQGALLAVSFEPQLIKSTLKEEKIIIIPLTFVVYKFERSAAPLMEI